MKSTTGDYQLASTLIEKDLGIYFDPSLKFTQHIAEIVKKANCRLGLIRRAFTSLDVQLFRVLYKSLVRPILEYGNVIWNPLFKKDILNLEKVQRRATKLVYVIKDMPYEVRLEYLDLPTLIYRRARADAIQTFKIINHLEKIDRSHFFVLSDTGYDTRHSRYSLYKRRVRTQLRHHSFSNRVINLWNSLPGDVTQAGTVDLFEIRLYKHWQTLNWKYSMDSYHKLPWEI
ncbi:hypothetical protein HOLleu_19634 [Holothuria leucospilota]|uniref:Uncharacterized protein n=1 Tax=Holothuria leucospilota TaxID=206669 RepID=A0A9Q1BZM6_HOLLE|nr:hypothetical protein HOLleu_19634 [Holothuria leucospilota]